MIDGALTRGEASEAAGELGWRFVLGTLMSSIVVSSLREAAGLAALLTTACGDETGDHLRLDLRSDRLLLTVRSTRASRVTARDVDLARRITATARDLGHRFDPHHGPRSVQAIEIGIDALDIAAIRPFWAAILGYAGEPGRTGPQDALVDPFGQGPAIWFQRMDAPRPQRNRIHFDVSVPHDRAADRIRAALDAGGTLVSDAAAPAFWILADAEGNEACVTTWQGRD
jgi:4a-hydroxytetrahydrobiopterin dehydratase